MNVASIVCITQRMQPALTARVRPCLRVVTSGVRAHGHKEAHPELGDSILWSPSWLYKLRSLPMSGVGSFNDPPQSLSHEVTFEEVVGLRWARLGLAGVG